MAATTTQPKSVAPAAFEAQLTKMIAGIQANLPAGTSLTMNGAPVKQAAILAALQGWLAQWQGVDTAQQAYRAAVQGRLASTVAARSYYKALKAVIKTYFGAQSALLASFGITADKPLASTTTTKLVAAAKRKQTRTLRGTKGKNQKAAITVVSNPPVSVASDGEVAAGVPTVNVPGSSTLSSTTSSAPASMAAPTPTSAPAGSGSGSGTPTSGSGTPAAS
jgi:hypothetical protein